MSTDYSPRLPTTPQDLSADVEELNNRQEEFGLTDNEMDQGVSIRRWPPSGPPTVEIQGQGDGVFSPQEKLQAAFRRLEEITLGRPSFRSELCADSSPRSSLFCYFRDHLSFLPPWFLDDGNPTTNEDAEARDRIDEIVHQAPPRLALRERTQYLLNSLDLPWGQGGLGVHYNSDRTQWKRDGVEAVRDRVGDCNARSFLFYAMAFRAGLNPTFLRVAGRRNPETGRLEEIFHIAVAVHLDPAHPRLLTPVDPSTRTFLDSNFQWYPISLLEMGAYHLRNVALYNFTDVHVQETLLLTALTLAPDDFEVEFDIARFYLEKERNRTEALRHFTHAKGVNSRLRSTWGP